MADSEGMTQLLEGAQYRGVEYIRSVLVGLTIDCPLDRNLEECPLHKKRALSFETKMAWIRSLSDVEVMDLYSQHHLCFILRSDAFRTGKGCTARSQQATQ